MYIRRRRGLGDDVITTQPVRVTRPPTTGVVRATRGSTPPARTPGRPTDPALSATTFGRGTRGTIGMPVSAPGRGGPSLDPSTGRPTVQVGTVTTPSPDKFVADPVVALTAPAAPAAGATTTKSTSVSSSSAGTTYKGGGAVTGGGGGGGGALPNLDFSVPDDAPDSSEFMPEEKEKPAFPVKTAAIAGAAILGIWLLTRRSK